MSDTAHTTDAQERAEAIVEGGLVITTRPPLWLLLQQAQAHLQDVEARHFSGACHLDELRAAYLAVQQIDRRFTVASEQPEARL